LSLVQKDYPNYDIVSSANAVVVSLWDLVL